MSCTRHDWSRDNDRDWWTCSRCPSRMHPSWTVESRDRFEMGCELLQLELTKPENVMEKFA